VADPEARDPEEQLRAICETLHDHDVNYVVFGSFAGRLQGADLRTLDVDIVPDMTPDNLQRLADALNSLEPRWRVAEEGPGMPIDGRLEPRHFLGDSLAVGLVTRAGYVDVVLHPKGFESGYSALVDHAVRLAIGDHVVLVGALGDLIVSKQQLAREKDLVHLPELRRRATELGVNVPEPREPDRGPAKDRGPGYDIGM
jgi:hypothetical protein